MAILIFILYILVGQKFWQPYIAGMFRNPAKYRSVRFVICVMAMKLAVSILSILLWPLLVLYIATVEGWE